MFSDNSKLPDAVKVEAPRRKEAKLRDLTLRVSADSVGDVIQRPLPGDGLGTCGFDSELFV